MNILGKAITDQQIAAGLAAMEGLFRAGKVEAALKNAGVPWARGVAMRVADALLRREKRAGRIVFQNGFWYRTGR